jgi:hypothetical protein
MPTPGNMSSKDGYERLGRMNIVNATDNINVAPDKMKVKITRPSRSVDHTRASPE